MDKAYQTALAIDRTHGDGHHSFELREAIAAALLKAREEAFEEAAKIVEGFSPIRPAFVAEDEGGQEWPHPAQQTPIYDPEKLASAIRLHSQQGER